MLTNQESIFVSYARVLAMFFIVACHILQAFESDWAFVLNVGVQMFFFISGFLYGRKDKLEVGQFFKSRLEKVYLPYVLYTAIAVATMCLVLGLSVTWQQILCYLFNIQGFIKNPIAGLNHLWFLSVLMVGYLLTPIVRKALNRNRLVTIACLIVIQLIEYLWLQKKYAMFTWIMLYLLGIIFGSADFKYAKRIGALSIPATTILLLLLPSVSSFTLPKYSVWLHVFLAVSVLAVIYMATNLFLKYYNSEPRWIKWVDSHSYEIYLTHHLYILGPCSLLFLSDCKILGVVLVILCTIVSSIVLKQLSKIFIK